MNNLKCKNALKSKLNLPVITSLKSNTGRLEIRIFQSWGKYNYLIVTFTFFFWNCYFTLENIKHYNFIGIILKVSAFILKNLAKNYGYNVLKYFLQYPQTLAFFSP